MGEIGSSTADMLGKTRLLSRAILFVGDAHSIGWFFQRRLQVNLVKLNDIVARIIGRAARAPDACARQPRPNPTAVFPDH
jgi:hypothetical protein